MYTLNPQGYTANKSRTLQAQKVKNSILYLINEYTKKLRPDDNKIKIACSTLINMEDLTPEIHFFHHRLQIAMRNQDVVCAKLFLTKIIESICSLTQLNEYISVTSIGDNEWEKFIISEAIRLTKEDFGEAAEINPLSSSELELAIGWVSAALCTIARHDPDMFDELKEHVKLIKLFNGKVTMGFTDVRILGAMLLRIPREHVNPVLYFVEHIVHEASHMHLNCLMSIDPLILNLSTERFISPLRPDPRPMIGVFHATYVSAKISRTLLKLYNSTDNDDILHPLAETLDETIRGIEEIEKSAKLTPSGEELVNSIKTFIITAKSLPAWQNYKFLETKHHRFGVGKTKVNSLYRAIA